MYKVIEGEGIIISFSKLVTILHAPDFQCAEEGIMTMRIQRAWNYNPKGVGVAVQVFVYLRSQRVAENSLRMFYVWISMCLSRVLEIEISLCGVLFPEV